MKINNAERLEICKKAFYLVIAGNFNNNNIITSLSCFYDDNRFCIKGKQK